MWTLGRRRRLGFLWGDPAAAQEPQDRPLLVQLWGQGAPPVSTPRGGVSAAGWNSRECPYWGRQGRLRGAPVAGPYVHLGYLCFMVAGGNQGGSGKTILEEAEIRATLSQCLMPFWPLEISQPNPVKLLLALRDVFVPGLSL